MKREHLLNRKRGQGQPRSITNPQQLLPLPEIAVEAHALSDLTKLLAGRGAPSLSAGLMRCYLICLTLVTTAPGNMFMTSRRA